MSNPDGENPIFDELMAGDEPPAGEPAGEPAAEPLAELPVVAEGEHAVETEPAEHEEPAKEEAAAEEKPEKKKSGKLPVPLEWGVGVAIPVLIGALIFLGIIYLSTAIYVAAVGFVAFAVWRSRATSSVYIVLLGCALVALLTAIYCLWAELGRYNFDIRAKQRSSISSPNQAGSLAQMGSRPSTAGARLRS